LDFLNTCLCQKFWYISSIPPRVYKANGLKEVQVRKGVEKCARELFVPSARKQRGLVVAITLKKRSQALQNKIAVSANKFAH
jgi:hypothetical protein